MLVETNPVAKIETFCRNRRTLLKIKIKSLIEEVKIIRHEESRCPDTRPHLRELMRQHRIFDIRKAMRSTYIAYGLMKGTPYLKIEPKAYEEPKWAIIEKMLESYQLEFNKEKRLQVITDAKEAFKQKRGV